MGFWFFDPMHAAISKSLFGSEIWVDFGSLSLYIYFNFLSEKRRGKFIPT